jgi:hypothetical protein
MNVQEAKRATMNALGLTDDRDVAYITQELLEEYAANSKDVQTRGSQDECNSIGKDIGYGTYGNSLVFGQPYVNYKAGPKGTPSYGCGNTPMRWKVDNGDTFTPKGTCAGGAQMYLLYCPTCAFAESE